jgi:hypothetical protein
MKVLLLLICRLMDEAMEGGICRIAYSYGGLGCTPLLISLHSTKDRGRGYPGYSKADNGLITEELSVSVVFEKASLHQEICPCQCC